MVSTLRRKRDRARRERDVRENDKIMRKQKTRGKRIEFIGNICLGILGVSVLVFLLPILLALTIIITLVTGNSMIWSVANIVAYLGVFFGLIYLFYFILLLIIPMI